MKFLYILAAVAATAFALPEGLEERTLTCQVCNPFPENNKCDITTSCVYDAAHVGPDGSGPYYCACRDGYKPDPNDPLVKGDKTAAFRLPWAAQKARVFVKPGVVCDTLCTNGVGANGCQEIPVRKVCN